MAFLLGCQNGTKVSRYENLARQPSFATAMAYHVIFGALARELFAGAYKTVEKSITKRAQFLAQKPGRATSSPRISRKLEVLKSIASAPASGSAKNL